MSERRSLVEGLKLRPETDRSLEEQFVYGKKPAATATPSKPKAPAADRRAVAKAEDTPKAPARQPEAAPAPEVGLNPATATRPAATISRVPFTTRMRSDIAQAMKRASLERQLNGVEPNTVQEILESALEPWLRANGYLS